MTIVPLFSGHSFHAWKHMLLSSFKVNLAHGGSINMLFVAFHAQSWLVHATASFRL